MKERDRMIYALMLLEIGDDISICDAHTLIQSVLYKSQVPGDVQDRIAMRTTNQIISGVFTNGE